MASEGVDQPQTYSKSRVILRGSPLPNGRNFTQTVMINFSTLQQNINYNCWPNIGAQQYIVYILNLTYNNLLVLLADIFQGFRRNSPHPSHGAFLLKS
jgi:hypothetical protein